MKKIALFLIILIGISVSCTKNFEEYNTDTKHATEVPGNFIFANALKALADQEASTNVNLNVWKLFAQYWTETTYTDESNYDIVNRNIASLTFRTYYRDILVDLKEARRVIELEVVAGEEATTAKENRLNIITIVEAYCYSSLIDMFGDIPYSQALDIDNISPVYDDAFTVYKDLLTKTKAATDGLNAGFGSFGSDDLYLGGDVSMWKKFGNTLIVKMAINLADVDDALAKGYIEGAYAGGYAFGEDCHLAYPGGTNSNPLYQDLVQSGRHDFVPANTIVDIMNNLNDPRRAYYFEINGETYTGGLYGYSNSFSQFSHIADEIQEETYPMVIMDYTELAFYLAEAAARNYSVGGTAQEHYNLGIKSSILHWGGTEQEYTDYIAQNSVNYATAAGDWKQKIGTQAWLAFYVRGFVGYTSWRRLDAPTLNIPEAPETADGQVPKRFTYPINEQTLNAVNYAAAAAAVGGDEMHTKLFWDKY